MKAEGPRSTSLTVANSRAATCFEVARRALLCVVIFSTGVLSGSQAARSISPPSQAPASRVESVHVLYLEGEPRFEYKFIRRAVADDPSIRMESVVYLQIGAQQEDEPLVANEEFSHEILMRHDVLILGNIGREALGEEQQESIAEWVEAGGSLLLLAGNKALAHGDWAGSPLGDLLPIEPHSPSVQRRIALPSEQIYESTAAMAEKQREMVTKIEDLRRGRFPPPRTDLEDQRRVSDAIEELKQEQFRLRQEMEGLSDDPLELREAVVRDFIPNTVRKVHVEAEPSALDHPVLAFEESVDAFLETLPALNALQLVAMPRDEAVVLLRDREDPSFTVLSYAQRGNGLCAVLAVTNTWHWQMHAEIAANDTRHERFWRRLLGWLGRSS